MAGAAGLAAYLGGQGQERARVNEANAQNAEDDKRLALQLAQQQQQFDATLAEQKARDAQAKEEADRQNGIDPTTGKPIAFNIPKSLQQIVPGNGGKIIDPATGKPMKTATPSADQYVQHYLALAAEALRQGNTQKFTEYTELAQQYALAAQHATSADFTSGAKTNLTNAQTTEAQAGADLKRAQAAAERDLPARARAIAAGHDQTSLARAQAEIASRTELAHYNGTLKANLAQLAAAYRVNGENAENAVKMAIAEYNGQVSTYRTQLQNAEREQVAGGAVTAPGAPPQMQQPIIVMPPQAQPGANITLYVNRDGTLSQGPPSGGKSNAANDTKPKPPTARPPGVPAAAMPYTKDGVTIWATADAQGNPTGMWDVRGKSIATNATTPPAPKRASPVPTDMRKLAIPQIVAILRQQHPDWGEARLQSTAAYLKTQAPVPAPGTTPAPAALPYGANSTNSR